MKEIELYVAASSNQVYVEELGEKRYVAGQGYILLTYN